MVRRLCDRRAGLGGDGVLRVVRSAHVPDAPAVLGADLRPLRVVHGPPQRRRVLRRDVRQRHPAVPARAGQRGAARPGDLRGRRPGRHPRRTAPGGRRPRTAATGSTWARPGSSAPGRRNWAGRTFPGLAVSMGNPHLACLTDVDVDALDLTGSPRSTPALFPEGVNVELVNVLEAGRAHPAAGLRARAWGRPAPAAPAPAPPPTPRWPRGRTEGTVVVDVPGGRLSVQVDRRDHGAHRPRRARGGRRAVPGVAGRLTGSDAVVVVAAPPASSTGPRCPGCPSARPGRCPGRGRRRAGCAAGRRCPSGPGPGRRARCSSPGCWIRCSLIGTSSCASWSVPTAGPRRARGRDAPGRARCCTR